MVRIADSFRYFFENITRSIRSLCANAPVASLRVQAQRRSGASDCRGGWAAVRSDGGAEPEPAVSHPAPCSRDGLSIPEASRGQRQTIPTL